MRNFRRAGLRRAPWLPAVLTASLVLVPGPVSAGPHTAAAPTGGSLVLVGGALADDNAEVYQDIVRLAGGTGRARIGIVTAASQTPAEDPDANTPNCNNSVCNGAYYADLFKKFGAADAQWIPVDADHVAAADDPAVVAQATSMTGFFFGGGDQFRYVTTLMHGQARTDTGVLAAIRARLAAGAVVAGTSAGTQIQAGADMITGGVSYNGLRDGSEEGYFDDADKLGYLSDGGFGFFSAGLLDTHFSRRGREGRSIRLAADTHHDRVFGVDENTALEVTGIGTAVESMRVLGQHGVSVFDLRSATVDRYHGQWRIRGVRWSYLTGGDTYQPTAWHTRFASAKSRVNGSSGCDVRPSEDVFYDYAMVDLAVGLADDRDCDSVSGTSYEHGPTFEARLTRGRSFTAFRGEAYGATVTSFVDVKVRIEAL
jgi:cyanophycinase